MRIIVISFADSRFSESIERLSRQAGLHPDIYKFYGYSEKNLPVDISAVIKNRLVASRGFGYWIWKPFIILHHLELLSDDEILIYIDAGCNIVVNQNSSISISNLSRAVFNSIHRIGLFRKPIDKEDGRIKNYYREENWTKEDVFKYFNVGMVDEIRKSSQIVSTVLILGKTETSLRIVKKWRDIMLKYPNLVDDSISKNNNANCFIENRHDQSILSVLAKKDGMKAYSTFLIEGIPALFSGSEIVAVRDINGRMPYRNIFFFKLMRVLKHPFKSLKFIWNPIKAEAS